MLNNTEYKELSAQLANEPRVKWFNIDDNEQRVYLDVHNATNSFSFDYYKGVKFLAKDGEAVARVIDSFEPNSTTLTRLLRESIFNI